MIGSNLDTAVAIANELQAWIENKEGLPNPPVVSVTWTTYNTLSIAVDDTEIWCSEGDGEEYLTFKFCKYIFLAHVRKLGPFTKEAAALPSDMPF